MEGGGRAELILFQRNVRPETESSSISHGYSMLYESGGKYANKRPIGYSVHQKQLECRKSV